MTNNRLFVAMPTMSEEEMEKLRVGLEMDTNLYDRYGDAYVAERKRHFGFATVVPKVGRSGRVRWFWRMLWCSYIYMPCGWRQDAVSCRVLAWGEFLNKRVIFEEDGRCR